MSAADNTGWRDDALSRDHRLWGYDVPAVDLDFVLLEFDGGDPAALVDYKRSPAAAPGVAADSVQEAARACRAGAGLAALRRLCDRAGIHGWVALYTGAAGAWQFRLFPCASKTDGWLAAICGTDRTRAAAVGVCMDVVEYNYRLDQVRGRRPRTPAAFWAEYAARAAAQDAGRLHMIGRGGVDRAALPRQASQSASESEREARAQ